MLAQTTTGWEGIDIGAQLFAFSPMIALTCTMLAIVGAPILFGRSAKTISFVASVGVLVTFFFVIRVARSVVDGGVSGLSTDASSAMLLADNLSSGFQLVLMLFLVGVMYLWRVGSAETEENAPEFFILLLGSALGMMLMTSTANLLMVVVAIETASLPSYAIVGFDKRDRRGAEASLKYMIFGAVCAAIMLYGVSLLYGLSGSLAMPEVSRYVVTALVEGENAIIVSLACLCLLAGIAFKISAVPFHFWCPDAFQGARIEVTTWLSVVSKAAGLLLLARLVMTLVDSLGTIALVEVIRPLGWGIGIMAAITATVGNFAAYKQTSVKRLLAYSSIAHAGYMLMATAVFLQPSAGGVNTGISALMLYVIIYMFMNLGAFTVACLVVWDRGSDDISSFEGLLVRSPLLAIPMVVCLMSLVGLPPFAGFLGKYWLLMALGEMGTTLGWFLVVVAVANTLFSLFYYMRLVIAMTLRDPAEPGAMDAPMGGLAIANGCAVILVLLMVFASPIKDTANRFAKNLLPAPTTHTADIAESGGASVALVKASEADAQ